jgi:GGDEF domain-containing protein
MFDGVMSDKESILDRADKAMYLSKNKGGNTIRFAILPEEAKKP